ncbi:helix-turn-helix domain-containing protein [uncultured Chitinophaga sp.]|uniref:winged helix-turn-helix transcriptional regulator n=1 Tax=uncultured Chitinophaga sp. TaxID=339340 RepID=UPI0025EA5E4B|nr:helix-turn-helix domain-containing protein [uncultured Chitinophaga sp.]
MQTYERKTPEDLDCGIIVFMKVLGGKWKPCIVDLIYNGITRPSEMHRQLPSATPRVIDMQLRELELHGLVCKTIQPGFPLRADYTLTKMGRDIMPIVTAMDIWGRNNGEYVKEVTQTTIPNKFSVTE